MIVFNHHIQLCSREKTNKKDEVEAEFYTYLNSRSPSINRMFERFDFSPVYRGLFCRSLAANIEAITEKCIRNG